MQTVVREGTGRRAMLDGWEVAGKTGTTQRARDAWFIGFTSDFVAGVWMGYDDNRPLTGVTGGGLPAEIWREVMKRIHAGRTPGVLNSIEPKPPIVVAHTPDQDGSGSSGDTLVQRIFRDVVRDLGGEGSDNDNNNLQPGGDR